MQLLADDLTTILETGNVWIDSLVTSDGDQWHLNYLGLFRPYVTYSFNTLPELINVADYVKGETNFLNLVQINNVRRALETVTELTGIEFREVSGAGADWYFVNGDYVTPGVTAIALTQYGYRFWPDTGEIFNLDYEGVLIFDDAEFRLDTRALTPGTYGYEVLLHELGHLLGLEHPFEGPVTLSTELDNTGNTLMSYNETTPYKTQFSDFDQAALLYLYGTDGLGGQFGIGSARSMILGTESAEVIRGSDATDLFIQISPDNDELLGLGGVDTVVYTGERADYELMPEEQGAGLLNPLTGHQDLLVSVERIEFDDVSIALDLDGNAGQIARLLGVMLGKDNWYVRDFVGIGLNYLDEAGVSYEELMAIALETVLGPAPSNETVINLLYSNLVGVAPPQEDLDLYTGWLETGEFSQAGLAVAAAEYPLNEELIGLADLTVAGLEYHPFGVV